MAAASVGLGFFSAVIFFWTPFTSLLAAVGLHDHAVAGLDQCAHAGRRERHALLARLDLAGHADDHDTA